MNSAILLAAGKSERFGEDKLFAEFDGKSVLEHSLFFLQNSDEVSEIILITNRQNQKKCEAIAKAFSKVEDIVIGGISRFESVKKGIAAMEKAGKKSPEFCIIHNAANPFATKIELKSAVRFLKTHARISGVAVGHPVIGTLKEISRNSQEVQKTVSRKNLWAMETPQVVRAENFIDACAQLKKISPTDDLEVLEITGFKTAVIAASENNRKITTTKDLPASSSKKTWYAIGEDSHHFSQSKKGLVLGGIKIPNHSAFEADSDGDVILHALCNAIASAMGKGSLGTYATQMCKNGIKNSAQYLQKILHNFHASGFSITHISISIEASRPKIDPLVINIKKSLGKILKMKSNISEKNIGITATSGEKLTPFGRGEGVKCTVILTATSPA